MKNRLIKRISDKSAKIGVIGMGYVGLPLALRYSEMGYQVLGFDVDHEKVSWLNASRSYIAHIKNERIAAAVGGKNFSATLDISRVAEVDAVIICVPTPLNKHREPDVSFIRSTMEGIEAALKPGQVISLESTTYPGTTRDLIKPVIERRGYRLGEDYFVVYSPEREDPGNSAFNTEDIPKICGGITQACLDVGLSLYGAVISKVVPVSCTQTAELTKLLENIHRAVNIGLVNEMKIIADKMGIDIFEVIDAAATKPFGFTPFYPGPGLGGHCIPIDPFYLTWKAREYGVHTRFIELSGEVNRAMPCYVVDKLQEGLNFQGKALNGSNVLVLGIAYKKNVGDMRESPAVEIMEQIVKRMGRVCYSDPFVPKFPKMREYEFKLESLSLTKEVVEDVDAVVIATNHDSVDYDLVRRHAKLIIDSRGVYREPAENILRA